jgi:hypothetical protein
MQNPRLFCNRLTLLEYSAFRKHGATIESLVSDHDPFHLIEADQAIAPIVEPRGACALVGRHRLCDLELYRRSSDTR